MNNYTNNNEVDSINKDYVSNNKVWNSILNITKVSREPDKYYIKRDIKILFHRCIHTWDGSDKYGPCNNIQYLYIYYKVDEQVYEDLWYRENYFDNLKSSKQYELLERKNIDTSIDPSYYYNNDNIEFLSSKMESTVQYIENNVSKHIFKYRRNGISYDEEWAFNSDSNLYYKVSFNI